MNLSIIGIGAAGNKASINLIEKGIIGKENIHLLNTTLKDIPEEYKKDGNMVHKFSSILGGCGKEPTKGHKHMLSAIRNKQIDLSSFITERTQEVVIVTSTGGGTGCGATPLVAKYFIQLGLPVHVFAFIPFGDEARELNNTLSFFKNMDDNIILHTIRNEDYLDYTNDYSAAEESANDDFAKQIEILTGSKMIASSQNIDDTDMYKVSTTTGYQDIQHIPLINVKNEELFNKTIKDAFDNIKCMEYEPTSKRLAVIINIADKAVIDDKLEVIKRYTGEPFETFRHIQYNEDDEEYIDIIASGMNFPKKGIIDINKKYKKLKEKMNSKSNSFDDIFSDIDMGDEEEFDMDIKTMNNPKDVLNFFRDIDEQPKSVKKENEMEEY